MLNIFYGDYDKSNLEDTYIRSADRYFRNQYKSEWFSDPFVKEMVKSVDKSTVLSNGAIDSPVLGIIPPERLSGGVKTLILAYKLDGFVFNGTSCGDNCAKWFLEIAKHKDITMNLKYLMDFGEEPFEIHVLNVDKVYTNMKDLILSVMDVEGL